MARNQKKARLAEEDRLVVRRLAGELTEEQQTSLRRREAEDPALSERASAIDAAWQRLAQPPAAPSPDLREDVLTRIRQQDELAAFSFRLPTAGTRAAAAAMLVLGVTVGLQLDDVLMDDPLISEPTPMAQAFDSRVSGEDLLPSSPPSLTDAYWRALEQLDGGESSGSEEPL